MNKKINIKSIRKQIGVPTILRKSHAHKSKKDYNRKKLKGRGGDGTQFFF
jgi:hypothetical protein